MQNVKKVAILLLALLVSCICLSVPASAREFLDSCDISAKLNADGTMRVSEIWSVRFTGQAENFERKFDFADDENRYELRSRDQYESIAVESVKVNGLEVKAIEPDAQGDGYVFTGEPKNSAYTIDVRAKADNETKTYEIVYTVSGAVKAVGNRALVAFRFFGESFSASVNNVTIDIAMPSMIAAADIALAEDASCDVAKVDGKVTYTDDFVTEILRADFTVPITAFSADQLGQVSGMSDFLASAKKFLKVLIPVVICVLLAAAIVYFTFFADKVKRRKLLKHAQIEAESVDHLPDTLSAVTAYKLLNPVNRINPKATARKVPILFAYAVLECISAGFIREESESMVIIDPETQQIPKYIRTTLNFLMTFATCDNSGRYVIDSGFASRIQNECETQYDRLVNLLTTFYAQIPSADHSYFKDAANVKDFALSDAMRKKAMEEDGFASYAKCVETALSGMRYDDPQLMSMLYDRLNPTRFFTCPTDHDSISALSNAMLKLYGVYVKSK